MTALASLELIVKHKVLVSTKPQNWKKQGDDIVVSKCLKKLSLRIFLFKGRSN